MKKECQQVFGHVNVCLAKLLDSFFVVVDDEHDKKIAIKAMWQLCLCDLKEDKWAT